MSQQALEYVASVPSGKLSPTERFVLRIIAEEFKDCHGSANFELKLLEEETRLSRRHLRRLLSGMPEILDYIPARGEGHYGQFKFPKLLARQLRVEKAPEGDIKKGTRRGQEGDKKGTPGEPQYKESKRSLRCGGSRKRCLALDKPKMLPKCSPEPPKEVEGTVEARWLQ